MKCQEVGAEGLCSDASRSHRRRGSGCLWEAALISEQEKRGHLRHCWKVNQSLGSFLLCWLLEGSPAQPEANFNTSSLCHSSGSSSCKQPRCAKGPPDSKCHTSVQAATLPTSGICFFSLQNTSLSPHALGLLLEELSDVERPGHDSPGCFWGQGAALGMAGPASSPWFQSIISQNSLKGPQPSAISYLLTNPLQSIQ